MSDAENKLTQVLNNHTIAGRGERAIAGSSAAARRRFKQKCMRNALEFANKPSSYDSWVAVGDFNMDIEATKEVVLGLPSFVRRPVYFHGKERDFIFSDQPLRLPDLSDDLPLAHDGMHMAIGVKIMPEVQAPCVVYNSEFEESILI